VRVENTGDDYGLFPWSPSCGEINYQAYGVETVEFHNELYGTIQSKTKSIGDKDTEAYLTGTGIKLEKQWIRENSKGEVIAPYEITLCSYIRNSIHHPENKQNEPFTKEELTHSIEAMKVQVIELNKD
jgi:hypothetical protein